MDKIEVEKQRQKMIKVFVMPELDKNEFHEVSPQQLEQYMGCNEHKGTHKRKQYHQLAIIAKVDISTTDMELDHLLRNDVRTLFIEANSNKPQDIELIFLKVNTAIDKFYMENSFRMPIGIAVQINGEQLTSGRLKNDNKPYVEVGHVIILTTCEGYKYCCFKEIVYVSNMWRYLDVMKIGDIVRINYGQIIAKVVKCGYQRPLTVEVMKAGYLSSFMSVQVPYYIETSELDMRDIAEIDSAIKYGAHFLVIADIKSSAYLHTLNDYIGDSIKLIGAINFKYVEEKFLDIVDHILSIEAIWLDNMFLINMQRQTDVVSQCQSFEKATLGTIPLKTCSDFKRLENHDRIKQIDCLFIEKSSVQKKFPLIAKKLLPVDNKQIDVPSLDNLSYYGKGIVNFVLRTMSSIACQSIVVSSACAKAALSFAIPQINCPVICVVKNDFTGRLLNLHRNLKPIVSDNTSTPIQIGVAFARQQGIFTTGDFIISISDSTDETSEMCLNLRAYYLPPLHLTDARNENI